MSSEPADRGWLLGVFAPTVVASLGALVVLRSGWVVSEAGLLGAFAAWLLAQALVVVTAFSTSALATNLRIGRGGAYFLISRTYGLEVGGAIALPLFAAQALGITVAALGVAELGRLVWPGLPVTVAAGLMVVGVGAAAWTDRRPPPWMVGVAAIAGLLGVVSLLAGASWGEARTDPLGPWTTAGFMDVFAVLLACSGLLSGLVSADELEDPERAIPTGVLGGALAAGIAQLLVIVGLANAADASTLADPLVWTGIAVVPALVVVGLLAVSAATVELSVRAAADTLGALAADRLIPQVFERTEGVPWGRMSVVALAFVGLGLGGLDAVARGLALALLTAFGGLNLVAGLEGLLGAPSFRPSVRVHGGVSLGAAGACAAAMLAIDPAFSVVAAVLELGVLWTLSRRSLQATFGDARHGLLLAAARQASFRLRRARPDSRVWRPHIVVFTLDLHHTLPAVRWADAFGQHRGLITVVHLVQTDRPPEGLHSLNRTDEAILRTAGIRALAEVVAVPDAEHGVMAVAQAAGLAGLHHNTAMFAYAPHQEGPERLARLLTLVRRLAEVDRCGLIHVAPLPGNDRPTSPGERARVVVWWTGRENHGDLMLLLAHLATTGREHRGTRIQLKTVVDDGPAAREMQRDFDGMIPTLRMDLDVDVVIRGPDRSVREVIARDSVGATLVFLGLGKCPVGQELAQAARLDELLRELPATCLVHNAGPFRGRLV